MKRGNSKCTKWLKQYDYFPPLSNLKTSFKFRGKEFLLENSLHGVKYFIDASRPMWERVLWFILFMVSIGLTIAIIVTIWDKFQTDPTLTGLDTVTEEISVEFPQIYLCYDHANLNHTLVDENNKELYRQVYNWRYNKPLGDLDPQYNDRNNFRDIFLNMIPNCGLKFTNCVYGGKKLDCGKNLTKVITPAGGCCVFNATEPFTIESHPTEFSFKPTAYDFKLFLIRKHDIPDHKDRPLMDLEAPTLFKIYPSITYTSDELHYFSEYQIQCHYIDQGPSLRGCRLNCLKNKMLERCGCLPWPMAKTREEECPLSKYSCIESNFTIDCFCTPLCDATVYMCKNIVEYPVNAEGDVVVEIPEWPLARYKREIRFGYLDLVVSFGGIAGLFLGYSLLTTVELIYYFTLRPYCGAVLDSSQKKHNIVTVHVIAPAKSPRKAPPTPKYFGYTE